MQTDTLTLTPMRQDARARRNPRGVFERKPCEWWIRYVDSQGRYRREKAGTKGAAIDLYRKRKTEALQGKKLPEKLRRATVSFGQIASDALAYSKAHKLSYRDDALRMGRLLSAFRDRAADSITPQDIERHLTAAVEENGWAPATVNRYRALVSLVFRLGIENGKVKENPARRVKRRREDNTRVRWLTAEEEAPLRAVIASRFPAELPSFDLALHTGMRRSEQYGLTWDCVDFEQRQITIPRSKSGRIRYVPLDDTALRALLELRSRGNGTGRVMVAALSGHGYAQGHPLKTPREWFATACRLAKVPGFTWHCLRHTFASRLTMAGVGLRDVQELMGHKAIQMTCRYAHLAPSHQLAAVRRLDGWGQKPPTPDAPTDTTTDTDALRGAASVPTCLQ